MLDILRKIIMLLACKVLDYWVELISTLKHEYRYSYSKHQPSGTASFFHSAAVSGRKNVAAPSQNHILFPCILQNLKINAWFVKKKSAAHSGSGSATSKH
jgi:hypothetical protein